MQFRADALPSAQPHVPREMLVEKRRVLAELHLHLRDSICRKAGTRRLSALVSLMAAAFDGLPCCWVVMSTSLGVRSRGTVSDRTISVEDVTPVSSTCKWWRSSLYSPDPAASSVGRVEED
jgi:hypothetical protein